MTALAMAPGVRPRAVRVEDLGELVPVSRVGGQGRVYRPQFAPASVGPEPVVVKLYRRAPPADAAEVLSEMVAFGRSPAGPQPAWLHAIAAWPLAVVHSGPRAAGIVMRDVAGRFAVPFVMPSGRRERVLLTLEHLLGADGYLELRGLGVGLTTTRRAEVAERVSAGLASLHRRGIAAGDIAPNNLLVAFGTVTSICFIDCDSMTFRGRSPLACVQTADWDLPLAFDEPPDTRSADVYKLGLVILRLFARSHDARTSAPHLRYVPVELRDLLHRSLDATAVNRPTAGEWQRALRGLLDEGRLDQRCPGPAAPPAVIAPPAASVAMRPAGPRAPVAQAAVAGPAVAQAAVARPVGASIGRPGHAPASAVSHAIPPAAGLWLRRAVVGLWIVAGSIVLLVVLSRLFAGAVPAPDSGGGSSAGAGPAPPYYRYYYDPGNYSAGRVGQGDSSGIVQLP
jgi:hypothetical protein